MRLGLSIIFADNFFPFYTIGKLRYINNILNLFIDMHSIFKLSPYILKKLVFKVYEIIFRMSINFIIKVIRRIVKSMNIFPLYSRIPCIVIQSSESFI